MDLATGMSTGKGNYGEATMCFGQKDLGIVPETCEERGDIGRSSSFRRSWNGLEIAPYWMLASSNVTSGANGGIEMPLRMLWGHDDRQS